MSLEVSKRGTSSNIKRIADSKKVLQMATIRDWQFKGTAILSGKKYSVV